MENKVVLGLSGGVDSSLAARLLTERGYRVSCLWLDNGVGSPDPAQEAAAQLGLRLDVIDIRPTLDERVCRPFAAAYLAGRTPNPCALCNPAVKFAALLDFADRIGAPWVATGHYAQAKDGALFKGQTPNDQSYLLARLRKDQLARCLFPLGQLNKAQVRQRAAEYGLAAAGRPDSMEICFIPDNDYGAWLERRGFSAPEGDFVDKNDTVLGRHKGIHRYTLGQGSGLGLSGPHKYYVSAILPAENQVVLSDGSDLFATEIEVEDLNRLADHIPQQVTARFRHSRTETPGTLTLQGDGALFVADRPVRAPTPGQLAVFYAGDRVLAGGWIK